MKLITNFHDYYDTSIGYGGINNDIIFKRKQKEIVIERKNYTVDYNNYLKIFDNIDSKYFYNYHDNYNYKDKIFFNYNILLLCGKVYPIIEYKLNFFYNFEEIKNIILEDIKNKKIKVKNYYFNRKIKNLEQFFKYNIDKEQLLKYHRFLKSPIILIKELNHNYKSIKIIVNPILKDIQFFKMIDSFQMYQELEMFISNFLIEIKPIIEVSDEVKRDKKGFDHKSFKNM